MEVIGILLAAGQGRRFDASGRRLKLIEARRTGAVAGEPLALAAALALRAALGSVVAVVRSEQGPNQERLRRLLEQAGCAIVTCAPADGAAEGMGASIACGIASRPHAGGWIIALADMPAIQPPTIRALRAAIEQGAASAAPYFRGQRGHPVAFGAACGPALAALVGDTGARAVLERFPPVRIDVDDPGILMDVDRATDL
jgi:molybdenum cofactor cytidylyltransferase